MLVEIFYYKQTCFGTQAGFKENVLKYNKYKCIFKVQFSLLTMTPDYWLLIVSRVIVMFMQNKALYVLYKN